MRTSTSAWRYALFVDEAGGESPCFADWAAQVSQDAEVLDWIDALPADKRQPNLVFAAARWCGVPAPGPYEAFRQALLGDAGTIRATILERATQTNEPGRLAVLTPVLSLLEARAGSPLALIEVGASAGLCLYPDRWSYDWSPRRCAATRGRGHADRDRARTVPDPGRTPAGRRTDRYRPASDRRPRP